MTDPQLRIGMESDGGGFIPYPLVYMVTSDSIKKKWSYEVPLRSPRHYFLSDKDLLRLYDLTGLGVRHVSGSEKTEVVNQHPLKIFRYPHSNTLSTVISSPLTGPSNLCTQNKKTESSVLERGLRIHKHDTEKYYPT